MPTAAQHTFRPANAKLDPLYPNSGARMVNVGLKPGTYLRGTVLGQLTAVNEVQTITFGGTPTGGTFKFSFKGQTTAAISWNATNGTLVSNVDTALEALPAIGAGGVVTAVGTMTAGIGTLTVTFSGATVAGAAQPQLVVADNSLTGTTPTLAVAETTAGVSSTTYGPYTNGAGDGSDPARCILTYGCVVTELGDSTVAGEWAQTQRGVPAYFGGGAVFNTAELVGLDAAALVDLGASLLQGTVTSGQVRF